MIEYSACICAGVGYDQQSALLVQNDGPRCYHIIGLCRHT